MLTIVVDGRARVGRAVESKTGMVYEAFLRCIMYLRTKAEVVRYLKSFLKIASIKIKKWLNFQITIARPTKTESQHQKKFENVN